MYRKVGKRCLDIVLAIIGLLILWPFLVVLAFLVWVADRGPSLFKQGRVGQNGEIFTLLKFRSMPVSTPSGLTSGEALHVVKLTKLGRFLRRTNVDELPQLINILKGEMSIVGYRPALPTQTELNGLRDGYNVHIDKPGLTGLAVIKGYDGMSDTQKAAFDGEYTLKQSFFFDIKLILQTFAHIVKKEPPVY